MITEEDFLKITQGKEKETVFRLGKIDPAYSTGRPSIVFDGETTATTKQYPYLSPYAPTAGDRVLLAKVAGSYLILGKVI